MRIRDTDDIYTGKYLPKTTMDQENKLMAILLNPASSESQRLFLVGRLWYFGYCEKKVMWVIRKYNRWENYKDGITEQWVKFVFRVKAQGICTSVSNPALDLNSKIKVTLDIIKDVFIAAKIKEPIFFMGNEGKGIKFPVYSQEDFVNKAAAIKYLEEGFHVLPKSPEGKHPSLKRFKKYFDTIPAFEEVVNWDFSHGVCLLGTRKHVFLDIDPEGMNELGISGVKKIVDRGYHYETTPRGGIHFFGLNSYGSDEYVNIRTDKRLKGKIEIIGYGGLIVAAPTKGYVAMGEISDPRTKSNTKQN